MATPNESKLFEEEKYFLNKNFLFSRLMELRLLVILFFSRPTDAIEKVFERNVFSLKNIVFDLAHFWSHIL